jgi:hypothetical protein
MDMHMQVTGVMPEEKLSLSLSLTLSLSLSLTLALALDLALALALAIALALALTQTLTLTLTPNQVTGVEPEEKKDLLKLCSKLGGSVAKKNADATSVTPSLNPIP